MSELITDEMAHDAAKAAYEADPLFRSIFGKILNPPEALPWDELPLDDILQRRKDAKAVLEAAAPLIAGQVLRDASGMFRSKTMPRQRLLDEATRLTTTGES